MKHKSLSNSNPFLTNKTNAHKRIVRCIASSTAIETGEPVNQIEAQLKRLRPAANRVKLA